MKIVIYSFFIKCKENVNGHARTPRPNLRAASRQSRRPDGSLVNVWSRVGLAALQEWFTRLYWSCDMPMSFISGFVTGDGTLEMRGGRIARKYLRIPAACKSVEAEAVFIVFDGVLPQY